jgi:hypothetical protein
MKPIYRLYQSYLLRLWKEQVESDWRASLQEVVTGECHYFSNLQALFTFLESQSDPPFPRHFEVGATYEKPLAEE